MRSWMICERSASTAAFIILEVIEISYALRQSVLMKSPCRSFKKPPHLNRQLNCGTPKPWSSDTLVNEAVAEAGAIKRKAAEDLAALQNAVALSNPLLIPPGFGVRPALCRFSLKPVGVTDSFDHN